MGSTEPPGKRLAGIPAGRVSTGAAPPSRRLDARAGREEIRSSRGGSWVIWIAALVAGGVAAARYTSAAPGAVDHAPNRLGSPFPWDIVVAIAAMILFVAILAAAEAALGSVRKTRLRQLAEEGVRAAKTAQRLLDNPPRFLATVQIGITLASMFAAAVAAREPMERLAAWIGRLARDQGLEWVAGYAFEASLLFTIFAVGFVELLLGELIPKQLATRNPEPIALAIAGPIEAMATVVAPLVWMLTRLSEAVVRVFGEPAETAGHLTEEEIKTIVEESEKEGVLDEQETDMIHSVLEFTDIVVREVMVPRIDMVCVEASRTMDDLLAVVLDSGHTRIPIYEETVDNIVGIVHAKDLLRVVRDCPPDTDIRSANVMRPVYYVPENMKVDDLLAAFQRTKNQLAIVVDEYGGTAGLVTLEDLIEEIVGPITDEYDVESGPSVVFVEDRVALVDARMAIDDVNEELGIRLPEEESETLGGFVFGLLGKIPTVGETVAYEDILIEVVEADSRRVTRVKITLPARASEEGQDDDLVEGR